MKITLITSNQKRHNHFVNLLSNYCDKLYVIQEEAELIGAKYKGRPCGSFGHISTFSFYPNKQITTGEGGMIFTNDKEIYDRCKSLRNLCFQEGNRFIHKELGWNYRLTNIQAALGIAQLEKLEETVKKKIKIVADNPMVIVSIGFNPKEIANI